MNLINKLDSDIASAMKTSQSDLVAALRLLKNALKNEQIKLGHDLNDDEALKVVAREAKQRRDSIAAYSAAGRADLVKAEQSELEVITGYLPDQMDEAELGKLIDQAITETGASGPAQIGQVIGKVMRQTAGRADGGLVARMVKERLGQV